MDFSSLDYMDLTSAPLLLYTFCVWISEGRQRLDCPEATVEMIHSTKQEVSSPEAQRRGLDFNRTNTSDSKARPEILWNKWLWASSSGDTRSYLTASLIPSLWCPSFTGEVKIIIKINFGWIVKIMKKPEVLLHYLQLLWAAARFSNDLLKKKCYTDLCANHIFSQIQ